MLTLNSIVSTMVVMFNNFVVVFVFSIVDHPHWPHLKDNFIFWFFFDARLLYVDFI